MPNSGIRRISPAGVRTPGSRTRTGTPRRLSSAAGEGGRSSGIGALLLGIPERDGLRFIGRVGTGFTEKDLLALKSILAPLHTAASPFSPALPRPETKEVTYVRPELVGEVRYGEMTSDGRLRHPSWRGLRPDKEPGEVVFEDPA